MKKTGVVLGLLFCFISAAFDVYVAFLTQAISTLLVIFYCFVSSGVLFLAYTLLKDKASLLFRIKRDMPLVVLANVSVLFNWGGLFYALRYLEPAVVGVASVACGPALTLVISAFDKEGGRAGRIETVISYLVLLSVGIMLYNSFVGDSGISSNSQEQRVLGIVSVVVCALGTVLYTIVSKRLFSRAWAVHEILATRNILMIVLCVVLILNSGASFGVSSSLVVPMLILVVVGHLLPVYLIQKTIFHLSAIHVSLVLLTLPVFTLALQYLDSRVEFSAPSMVAIIIIVLLLGVLALYKVNEARRVRND
ncbi:EamA family transporter [Pseudomonas sp. CCM 7891]|uniref:EamA family transporter n=1 Tax=Pseudomonas karstica TaxID=1055468 RepID=A0A7X2RVS2_9PSED|nr:DMT family transporter [Pseudomonas karstica]MTD20965.1 EamA family transporter [Pseudomonas karstica]